MNSSIRYDVALGLFEVGGYILVLFLIIGSIEASVMLIFKWDKFWKSFQISLAMNVISTAFGMVGISLSSFVFSTLISISITVIITFVLSVLIEAGFLMLIKRNATRLNWLVSLIANTASYTLVILPLAWLSS